MLHIDFCRLRRTSHANTPRESSATYGGLTRTAKGRGGFKFELRLWCKISILHQRRVLLPTPCLHLGLEDRALAWRASARDGNHAQARSPLLDDLSRAAPQSFRRRRASASVRVLPLNDQTIATDQRANFRKMVRHPALRTAVIDRLHTGWTPEQIAGRLRLERAPQRVSHETVYQYTYSKDGHAIAL